MSEKLKKLPAAFWRCETNAEPVREWLQSLDKADRFEIGTAIKTVEYGWPLGMPVCRYLRDGVWEARADLPTGRIARGLFCLHEEQMVLLNGFTKKTQKTPRQGLTLALTRKRALQRGGKR